MDRKTIVGSANKGWILDRKTPEELKSKIERVPLSTRVKEETRQILEKEAKKVKTSLSDLTAGILDEYADWLINKRKNKGN